MCCFSIPSSEKDPLVAGNNLAPSNGKSPAFNSGPCPITTARSMAFSSSLMLPGQGCAIN